jgi:hypothetical protein
MGYGILHLDLSLILLNINYYNIYIVNSCIRQETNSLDGDLIHSCRYADKHKIFVVDVHIIRSEFLMNQKNLLIQQLKPSQYICILIIFLLHEITRGLMAAIIIKPTKINKGKTTLGMPISLSAIAIFLIIN